MRYFGLFLCLFLSSCGIIHRTRTITNTRTEYVIDTVVHITFDRVPKVSTVQLNDTAMVENTTSVARAYYNVATQRIVLTLVGKTFDVPVQLQATRTERIKNIDVKRRIVPWWLWYIAGFITASIIFLYLKIKK